MRTTCSIAGYDPTLKIACVDPQTSVSGSLTILFFVVVVFIFSQQRISQCRCSRRVGPCYEF